jgi:hypothetical protein
MPGLFWEKCSNFSLSFDKQLHRYRLYTSGRETRSYLAPEDWRYFISYDTIEDTTGLLGIYEAHIDLSRFAKSFYNS